MGMSIIPHIRATHLFCFADEAMGERFGSISVSNESIKTNRRRPMVVVVSTPSSISI